MRGSRDTSGRESFSNNNNGQHGEIGGQYLGSNSLAMLTPGDRNGHGGHDNSHRDSYPSFQPTLGQMADQFQERARVERKEKISRKRELAEMEENGGKLPPGYSDDKYGVGGQDDDSKQNNGDNYNYDDGSEGEDGGGDNYGYDDGEGDGEGDGDGGDEDPSLIATGNESTGRWTRPEHELFLQALKKYGKVNPH